MYSVTINLEKFAVAYEGEKLTVNDIPIQWDIQKLDDRTFHILKEHTSHAVELIQVDHKEKLLTLKFNNKTVEIRIRDRFDLLLDQLGIKDSDGAPLKDIKAPMPGLILDINVKVGDLIRKGDPVLVLEAMKMENTIKSPGDGEVKAVLVEKGAGVEKNQVLVQF